LFTEDAQWFDGSFYSQGRDSIYQECLAVYAPFLSVLAFNASLDSAPIVTQCKLAVSTTLAIVLSTPGVAGTVNGLCIITFRDILTLVVDKHYKITTAEEYWSLNDYILKWNACFVPH